MSSLQNSNKRIAKNTIIVYARIIVSMVTGLIASRLVLDAIGASDFGLYTVVGGIVAMFSVISGAMSTTTTRFLNFEMGRGKEGNVNHVFNISHVLHISFALLIFVLLEIIGLWYILNVLRADPGKEADAMFVFQISTITACMGVLNIPFQSVFIAYEKFFTIAVIDLSRSLLLLIFCVLLQYWPGNGLRFYAICMSGSTIFSFIAYYVLCFKYWPNVIRWHFVKEIKAYKDMLIYNNWTLLGTAADVSRNQGSNMLINYFFGTTVNAAYSISYQVMQHIGVFVSNFDKAVAPQITQNIGSGTLNRSVYLAQKTCRMCVLLVEIMYFSLLVELDFVLNLWLGENIPEGTSILCQYVLIIVLISSTSGGLVQLINGLKDIKWFKVLKFVLYLLCLPLGFLAFKMELRPYFIVLLFLVSDVINRILQFVILERKIDFDSKTFIMDAYWRPFVVLMILIAYVNLYWMLPINSTIERLSGILLTATFSSIIVCFVGLYPTEREILFDRISKYIFGRKN